MREMGDGWVGDSVTEYPPPYPGKEARDGASPPKPLLGENPLDSCGTLKVFCIKCGKVKQKTNRVSKMTKSTQQQLSSKAEETPTWREILQRAPAPAKNPLSAIFQNFQDVFREVKTVIEPYLREMYRIDDLDRRKMKDSRTKKLRKSLVFDSISFIEFPSLQEHTHDPYILTPLLGALPHITLGVPGTLDCSFYKYRDHPLRRIHASTPLWIRYGGSSKWCFELDGSPESAWERIILEHACFLHLDIITDIRRFVEFQRGICVWESLTKRQRARLLTNRFGPEVTIQDGVAHVSYYVFTYRGGFIHTFDDVDMSTGEIVDRTFDIFHRHRDKTIVRYGLPNGRIVY